MPSVVTPVTANDPTRVVAPATIKPGVVEPESVSCPERVVAPETVIDPLLSAPVVVIAPDPTSIDAPVIAPTCRVPSVVVPVTANDPTRVVAPATIKP